MRRVLVVLAILVAVHAQAQPADVCASVPPGGEMTNIPVEDYERSAGIHGKCVSLFDAGQVSVFLFKTPEIAKSQVEAHKTFSERDHMGSPEDPNPHAQPYAIGDGGYEVIKDQNPPGNTDSPVRYNIAFSRGCYQVYINAGGAIGMSFVSDMAAWNAKKEWVRTTAASVDAKLTGQPCPDEPGTPPPPPPGALGVTIDCQSNFDQADLVVCTARPQNQKADAALSYEWAFDGATQSIRGSELTKTGVLPGPHTVSVIASDSVNQLVSAPATAAFTKQEPGSSGGGGGGGGGSGLPPIVPVVIVTTVVVVGGTIAIIRGMRPRPAQPLVPSAVPPLGAMPPSGPPAQPPERLLPPRPPPPERLAPPRPPAPPERLANPPRPGDESPSRGTPAPTQTRDDQNTEGEVWLEAGMPEITVLADGRQEITVTVRACQLTGGVVTDASADVLPRVDATLPKKIYLTNRPGYCAFGVRGIHAGATPVTGKITVSGTSRSGRRVRPAEVAVHLQPVKIDVKIKVWKKGFRFQEVTATLPGMCREVRATAEGGEGPIVGRGAVFINALRGGTPDGNGPLAKAHCTASLRVGDGGWSSPVEVRTDDRGRFHFGLPPRMIQLYGDDLGSYTLPTTFQLGLNDEVKDALRGYRTALGDFQKDLTYNPAGSEYAKSLSHCSDYPAEFLDQLRENDEDEYLRAIGAIHRLRCSLLFALKYRRDMHSQRRLLNMAANETLGSVVDVITDFIPVAMGIFGWLAGKGFEKVINGTRYVLPGFPQLLFDLARGTKRIPGMRWAARGMLFFLRFLKAPVMKLENAVTWLLEKALDMAQAGGLKTQYLKDLARLGRKPNELPIKEIFDDADDPLLELASRFAGSTNSLAASTVKCILGLMHALVIVIVRTLQFVAFFIKNMDWGAESSWAATIGEIIEDLLGQLAGAIYDNFGAILEGLIKGAELIPTPPTELSNKNAADVVMDAIVTVQDLDARCAPELQRAYEKSHALTMSEEWEEAVRIVSKQELAVMAKLETAKDAINVLDTGAPFVKLGVKLVQMVTFAWGTLAATAVRVVGKIAQVAPRIPYITDLLAFLGGTTGKHAMDFAGYFEKAIDVMELILVRGVILLKEIVALGSIYAIAPTRIKGLYEK